jgi:hypothetical protein
MSKADDYRRMTQECLRLADQVPETSKTKILEMAAEWHRLVLEVEQPGWDKDLSPSLTDALAADGWRWWLVSPQRRSSGGGPFRSAI